MLHLLRRLLPSRRDNQTAATEAVEQTPTAVEDGSTPASMRRRRRRRLARGTQSVSRSTGRPSDTLRRQRDMDMARDVQRSFLPAIPEMVNGVRMLAEYKPAYDIGGDFYDLIHAGPDRFLVVIGDVSGKGVAAALMMSRIIAEFRRCAVYCSSPNELLCEVNEFMTSQPFQDCFVTATCIDVNTRERTISVANAGHVPPVLRRRLGDTALVGEASGAPLGLVEDETYRCDVSTFEPEDILILVTDGVTEALEPMADPAAGGVLTRMVANTAHDIHELKTRILGALTDRTQRHADDVALFAMQMA